MDEDNGRGDPEEDDGRGRLGTVRGLAQFTRPYKQSLESVSPRENIQCSHFDQDRSQDYGKCRTEGQPPHGTGDGIGRDDEEDGDEAEQTQPGHRVSCTGTIFVDSRRDNSMVHGHHTDYEGND